jgi:hypothetical protein
MKLNRLSHQRLEVSMKTFNDAAEIHIMGISVVKSSLSMAYPMMSGNGQIGHNRTKGVVSFSGQFCFLAVL